MSAFFVRGLRKRVQALRLGGPIHRNFDLNADHAQFIDYEAGGRVIELFPKVSHFMEFGVDRHKQAELAKLVLSNLSLTDGTLRYRYQNPSDKLLKLSEGKGWW